MASVKGHKRLLFRLYTATFIVMAITLASCHHDTIDDSRQFVTLYPVVDSHANNHIETRALGSGYQVYEGEARQRIYAHAVAYNGDTRSATDDMKGYFSPVDNGWRSSLMLPLGLNYYIYAYTSIPGVLWSNVNFTFNSTSDVKATFNGISILSETDPLVCRASAGATDDAPLTAADLTEGEFQRMTIQGSKNEQNVTTYTTKVYMAMDHLYAKANIKFKMDDIYVYQEYRTIKLKEVSISTKKGMVKGTHTLDLISGDLTLANKQQSDDEVEVTVNLMNGPSSTAVKDAGTDVVTLTTTQYKPIGWFTFLPIPQDEYYSHNMTPEFTLNVLYDVYDSKGQLTRENQKASNSNILNGIIGARKGDSYDVNITVTPTYLYQLSDNDVEFKLEIKK